MKKAKLHTAARCLAAGLMLALPGVANAQAPSYPSRTVSVVVPTPAGGGVDFVGRLVAQYLQTSLNKSFIVENKGGASGNIGTLYVARAQPDGLTLLLGTSGYHVTNPALFPNNGWDPVKDFAPIALIVQAPHMLVVHKSFPASTLKEFIAYGKANQGKINYATPGIGTQNHIGSELLGKLAGIHLTHVPYRGSGPATADLVSGVVEMMINTPQSLIPYINNGDVKPLVMASAERFPLMPNVPSATEAGLPGFTVSTWYGLYAPAGTPKEIITLLADEIKKMLARDDVKKLLDQNAFEPAYMGPEEFGKFTASQLEFWTKAINELGIKVEQ